MKISQIDLFTVRVPMKPGTVHCPEFDDVPIDRDPRTLMLVHTDSGLAGMGEHRSEIPESEMLASARALLGLDPLKLCLKNLPIARDNAYFGFEIALFDLVGRARDMRVCDLLGGAVRTRIEVDYWTGRRRPEVLAEIGKKAWDLGFRGLKIKCKLEDPMVERVQAVYAVAPDLRLTIDPNGRFYRPAETIRLYRQLERYNVFCLEDPVERGNWEWHALIRRKTDIPIACHVNARPEDLLAGIKAEAMDYANLSPHCLVTFVRMAEMAEAAGIPCWKGSSIDLGVLDLASMHACAAAANVTLASDLAGNFLREDDFLVKPIPMDGAFALLPDGPGLGGELDMQAVERYLVRKQTLAL